MLLSPSHESALGTPDKLAQLIVSNSAQMAVREALCKGVLWWGLPRAGSLSKQQAADTGHPLWQGRDCLAWAFWLQASLVGARQAPRPRSRSTGKQSGESWRSRPATWT